jgi:EAL domain-containing protein (putative c-di-GMP-specific phosphodiesterase class I)
VDVDFDRVAFHFLAPAVELLLELLAGKHRARTSGERFEERELARRQVDRALADAREWRDQGLELVVGVNLSARQLQQADLAETVARALSAHGMEARTLRLEVAEPVLLDGGDATHRTLRALQALGVQMAIDNFGSGFSSLGLVRGLPFSVVKVDRVLVSSCPSRRECAAIVQATSSMAHALGVRVIAQGVESEEQRALMVELGCDGAQGHYFSEPADPRRIAELGRASARYANFV